MPWLQKRLEIPNNFSRKSQYLDPSVSKFLSPYCFYLQQDFGWWIYSKLRKHLQWRMMSILPWFHFHPDDFSMDLNLDRSLYNIYHCLHFEQGTKVKIRKYLDKWTPQRTIFSFVSSVDSACSTLLWIVSSCLAV